MCKMTYTMLKEGTFPDEATLASGLKAPSCQLLFGGGGGGYIQEACLSHRVLGGRAAEAGSGVGCWGLPIHTGATL